MKNRLMPYQTPLKSLARRPAGATVRLGRLPFAMRFCFRWLVWVCGLSLSVAAWGNDLVISRAFLVDRAGTLSIDQAIQADFKPVGPILSKGYTDTVHWVRLQVRAPNHGDEVDLRIRPTYLDEVRLYEPDATSPGGWKTRVTGDRYSYQDRDRAAIALGFVVRPQVPETTYYLRLKTTSTSLLNVEALEPRVAQIKDLRLNVFQMFYLGVMLWLLFWAMHDYANHRQPVIAWFLLYQLTYIAFDLAVMGYLAPFVPAENPQLADLITSLLIISLTFLAIVFHRTLFRLYAPPVVLMRGLEALMPLYPLQLAAMAWGYTRMALQINALVILSIAVFSLVLPFTASQESAPSRRVLRIIYSLQTLSLLVSMLPIMGWVEAIEWNLNATIINGLISGSLMFLVLHLRSRQLLQEGQRAGLELELARQQLQLERAQKEQQGRFMDMLTHELKTPMSVVRMALGALKVEGPLKRHADRALEDMNDIVERCQQVDQLEQQKLILRPELCRLDEILLDLRLNSWAPGRLCVKTESLPDLNTDPQLLRIILGNLISNAIKYAAQETVIEIGAIQAERQGKSGVLISIQNQPGPAGLPDPEQVFDKYYRSPGAHSKTGSGLGLYLARNITELLGGVIAYDVMHEKIRFTLWLPC